MALGSWLLKVGITAITLTTFGSTCVGQSSQTTSFEYRRSPLDNPLRGLVPYAASMPWLDSEEFETDASNAENTFPHSMEFQYFAMSELMVGENEFDWSLLEKWLRQTSQRGCQLTFRVYLEYPSKKSGVPRFLLDQGVKVTPWKHEGVLNFAPDYQDPRLRLAVDQFVAALGSKYDGDPRIGCITMGLLGHWGEWHSYPRSETLFPGKAYQKHVMNQFAEHFKQTQVLMRYPAGNDNGTYASNAHSSFGFHDDSFAWATIQTGKVDDSWYFLAAMEASGTLNAWKTRMIGGEIRPEVWGCVFDDPSCTPTGQEFGPCVRQTHVSWLMDTGMFGEGKAKSSERRLENAYREVSKMGYELSIKSMQLQSRPQSTRVRLSIQNLGVAPFYYDWPLTVAVVDKAGRVKSEESVLVNLPAILPTQQPVQRTFEIRRKLVKGDRIAICIENPMEGGKPLRFANEEQKLDGKFWVISK